MSAQPRDVCITGYGLVSPLGETEDEWWSTLSSGGWTSSRDNETFRPFSVYRVGEIDLSSQIPKRGDQRAMGPMMQYGAYAAGLALEMAGLKGNEELLRETHLVTAAGGGERDWDLDEQILGQVPTTNDREALLNRELADGLRPTLFLAQLPNLFAGNISIVHGVSGSSRTFMGEEAAGVDAVRIGYERIRGGQADIVLVGAAFNAARPDLHLMYHAGGVLSVEPHTSLWGDGGGGVALGSAGGFIVLEARESAEARGAQSHAVLDALINRRTSRDSAKEVAEQEWEAMAGSSSPQAVLSGASGYEPATRPEYEWLMDKVEAGVAVRGTAEAVGHSMEASFLQNLILAIMCIKRRALFDPLSDDPIERIKPSSSVDRIGVTAWGHLRGEGLAIVEAEDAG